MFNRFSVRLLTFFIYGIYSKTKQLKDHSTAVFYYMYWCTCAVPIKKNCCHFIKQFRDNLTAVFLFNVLVHMRCTLEKDCCHFQLLKMIHNKIFLWSQFKFLPNTN